MNDSNGITQILGNSGAGKTQLLFSLAEENIGKKASLIIDIQWDGSDLLLSDLWVDEFSSLIRIDLSQSVDSFQNIFFLQKLLSEKKTILCTFPMWYMGQRKTCAYIILILQYLLDALKNIENEVAIYIDEFQYFQIPEMMDLLFYVQSYPDQFSMIFAHQYLDQLSTEVYEISGSQVSIHSFVLDYVQKRIVFPIGSWDQIMLSKLYPWRDFSNIAQPIEIGF